MQSLNKKPIDTFAATIYGASESEKQDVFVYINYITDDIADCQIKMPLFVNPSALRSDVQTWLWDYNSDLKLGDLTLAPNKFSAP